jgi:hypothetical protein
MNEIETHEFTEEELDLTKNIPKKSADQIERELREELVPKVDIEHPKLGRLVSTFSKEVCDILKKRKVLFYRPNSREVIEIGKIKLNEDSEEVYTGFVPVKPKRFRTIVEKYINPGVNIWNEKEQEVQFKYKTITTELADTVLQSQIIEELLPKIDRIFTIPIPIKHNGKLTFPKQGFDERFNSWLPYDSPKIKYPEMSLEQAKEIIENILKEFCFQTPLDKTNAIAGLLTPFLRGLFTKFCKRTPIFFYLGNRERVGKDYLAGITGIIYEGNAAEEPPISSNENKKSNNSDEFRKKILSAMIHGRKRLHFSNNKGNINNASFESISTSEHFEDRVLGKNELRSFPNELDFSLSGNVGVTFTPDFAFRCRFIKLFFGVENINERKFERPDLHKWVTDNRELVLSALYGLVRNWIDNGSKKGSLPFTSFHEWAEICGGIMESAGYDSPCEVDKEISVLGGGDSETQDMKSLFEICYEKSPNQQLTKKEIRDRIEDEEIFGYLDFTKNGDKIRFTNKINKFIGRTLSGITLTRIPGAERSSREKVVFEKSSTHKSW